MTLRFRRSNRKKTSEHALDTFSQAWRATTQWKNPSRNQDQNNNSAARSTSISIPPQLPAEAPSRPLRKPPITRALLDKALAPLPPEANVMVPPEKSPLRAKPNLADHPALKSQTASTSAAGPSKQTIEQARPPYTTTASYQSKLTETARHASVISSDWSGRRRRTLWDFSRTTRRSRTSDDMTIELSERPPMIDRGTQTTPSLERPKPGPIALPPLGLKDKASKHSPLGRRLLQRGSESSEEKHRTPLWSPRSILKTDQPVDYFCIAVPEETEDDGGVESQFRSFLKNLKSASPHSPSSRRRSAKTTDNTDSADSVATYESRCSPRTIKPKVVRRTQSDDHSTESTKATPSIEASRLRPAISRQDTAPASLSSKKISSGISNTPASPSRPLPLPLQRLASLNVVPSLQSRQSRSDSAPNVVSPLRQELKRKASVTPSAVPPTLPGPGMNFKINRPRVIQLPPRGEIGAKQGSTPVTPEDEGEAADLFMYRVPFLKSKDDDEYLGLRRVEQNVPEHFAGSPLCPMSPKHKSGGWGVCPFHGQRRTSDSSLLTSMESKPELRESSLAGKRIDSLQKEDSEHARGNNIMPDVQDTRRSSANTDHAWNVRNSSVEGEVGHNPRKSSVDSEKVYDARKSSSGSSARYRLASRYSSALDDDMQVTPRPTLGRQGSWAVGHNDGAVRGFGYEPPRPDPPTPPLSIASSSSDMLTPVVEESPRVAISGQTNIINMLSRDPRNADDQPVADGADDPSEAVRLSTDHSFPIPRRRPDLSFGEQMKGRQDSNVGKQRAGRPTLNQGGRVGIRIESSDSVPRFRMF